MISQDERADSILITIRFGNITDIYGGVLPEVTLKIEEMPPQIGSNSEAVAIQAVGEAAVVSTVILMSSTFSLN